MQEEIEQLKQKVAELEAWKAQKEQRQVSFPLDTESLDTLNKYFVRVVDDYVYLGGASDNSFPTFVCVQDNFRFDVHPGLVRYTADAASDFITIVDKTPYTKFGNDETLVLFTTDTAPGGLSGQGLTTYYVVSAAANGYSFKLSATEGGAAINITNAGTGRQFLERS